MTYKRLILTSLCLLFLLFSAAGCGPYQGLRARQAPASNYDMGQTIGHYVQNFDNYTVQASFWGAKDAYLTALVFDIRGDAFSLRTEGDWKPVNSAEELQKLVNRMRESHRLTDFVRALIIENQGETVVVGAIYTPGSSRTSVEASEPNVLIIQDVDDRDMLGAGGSRPGGRPAPDSGKS